MAKRSRDWNETLASELRDPEFAREFLMAMLDEGLTLQAAIAKTIRSYGVKEFARKARMPSSNIVRSIDHKHNPTQRTLDRLLKPFGLRLAVAPRSGRAA
jgi:DNA-binding phage protein